MSVRKGILGARFDTALYGRESWSIFNRNWKEIRWPNTFGICSIHTVMVFSHFQNFGQSTTKTTTTTAKYAQMRPCEIGVRMTTITWLHSSTHNIISTVSHWVTHYHVTYFMLSGKQLVIMQTVIKYHSVIISDTYLIVRNHRQDSHCGRDKMAAN